MPRQTRTTRQSTLVFATKKISKGARGLATAPPAGRATRNRPSGTVLTAPSVITTAKRTPRCTVCKKVMKGHGKSCLTGLSKAAALDRANDRSNAYQAQLQDAFEQLGNLRLHQGAGADGADLDGADLDGAGADGADLDGADLDGADLGNETSALMAMAVDIAHAAPFVSVAPVAPVQETSMAVDDAAASGAAASGAAALVFEPVVVVAPKTAATHYVTTTIPNGLKSTPSGDTELPLVRNGYGKAAYPTQAMRAKRTNGHFQAVVQKADELVRRIDGWAFAFFIPKEGRGEMRSWASNTVVEDVPELPAALRRRVFEALEPVRKQVMDEKAKEQAKREKELRRLQRKNTEQEEELARMRSELEDTRCRVRGA